MRVLNTNLNSTKKYSRFCLPGFRSGSLFKRIVALFYYFFVLIFMCVLTVTYCKGTFSGAGDVFTLILTELIILAIFLTPVIAIGYSDHFDWHGIKLFLIIMVPWCVLFTLGNWVGTLFSMSYIESVNPSEMQIQEVEIEEEAASDGGIAIEQGIVEEALQNEESTDSSAS